MRRSDSTAELRLTLPLLEEAAGLLRRTPPRAWACYLLGAGPFILMLIPFWSALCGQPQAQAQPLVWALPLALLHLWMRVWQSRFCTLLLDLRNGRASGPWSLADWFRAAVNQCRFGVPAFVALLPALLITVPYGWVYAFYQNIAVTANAPDASARAWKAARHAPYQNHAILAWLLLCSLIAFVNVFSVVMVLPGLVKLFVPVEWAFTRYPLWFLNTTALCAILAITYLVTDPLVKAVYVLRTFYGLSQATGEDLLTDWRRLRPLRSTVLTLLILLSTAAAAAPAKAPAADAAVPSAVPSSNLAPAAGSLAAETLDTQIDRALRSPRYDWRTPVELNPRDTWLTSQIGRLTDTVSGWARAIREKLRSFGEWWARLFRSRDKKPDLPKTGLSVDTLSGIITALLLGTAAVLLFLLWRSHRRTAEAVPVAAVPQAAAPDVADESVTAEVLPDDEWLRLAEQLRAAQDYRKAARAFFLALLACLGRRGLIALQKSKTNADYLREIRRRTVGHLFDDQPFRHASHLFEAGWYGDHLVTGETLDAIRADVEVYRHE